MELLNNQNGSGWLLWMWFYIHSHITENLTFLNSIRLKDTTLLFSKQYLPAVASCNIIPSSSPHVTFQTITNTSLTSTLTSCQVQL